MCRVLCWFVVCRQADSPTDVDFGNFCDVILGPGVWSSLAAVDELGLYWKLSL